MRKINRRQCWRCDCMFMFGIYLVVFCLGGHYRLTVADIGRDWVEFSIILIGRHTDKDVPFKSQKSLEEVPLPSILCSWRLIKNHKKLCSFL